MKLYFGLAVRYQYSKMEMMIKGYTYRYGIKLDDGQAIDDDICASCVGCLRFDEENKTFSCVPFETDVHPWDAESPDIPCSKYKRMRYKKL